MSTARRFTTTSSAARKAGHRLRVLRAERDWRQYAVAADAHICPSRYWRIETGIAAPTPDELARLAKLFRVPEAELGF